MRKSNEHYRFCDSREILLIGDDVYGVEVSAPFDPEGTRIGARRLMSRKDWDDMSQASFNDGSLILNDTTVEFNPAYISKPFLQDQCAPYWSEYLRGISKFNIKICNGTEIHECLAIIKERFLNNMIPHLPYRQDNRRNVGI